MEITKVHWVGIGIALVMVIISLFLIGTNIFFLILGIGILIGAGPFVFTVINEGKINYEKEEMFLEFARNLVESVKTGASISKSIINLKNKPYGVLSEHVKKLANQISMGIPLNFALKVFSKDVNNKTVNQAITLIGQAERAGGNIGEILESVAGAVSMSDRLKKERKGAISTLVVQGYIIFFVFLVIILVMQYQILPLLDNFSGLSGDLSIGSLANTGGGAGGGIDRNEISNSFLYMILIQGFFSGLVIGKLSEGSIKGGIKHSFALVVTSFLVSTIANVVLGGS